MEGLIAPPPPSTAQWLEALNTARARYDQALHGDLRKGEDRWTILYEMNQAIEKAKHWLSKQGVEVSYSLPLQRYMMIEQEVQRGTGTYDAEPA